MRQFGFAEQSIGHRRGVSFIHESDWPLGRFGQPSRELPCFFRFGAVSTIAVDGQADHPASDLMVADQFLKKGSLLRFRLPMNRFERVGPGSARIANRQTDANGSVVDANQASGIGPG